MNDKKQTAINWLIEYCDRENWNIPNDIISYAKELEKRQIVEAHLNGQVEIASVVNEHFKIPMTFEILKAVKNGIEKHEDGEIYYSQTYNQ